MIDKSKAVLILAINTILNYFKNKSWWQVRWFCKKRILWVSNETSVMTPKYIVYCFLYEHDVIKSRFRCRHKMDKLTEQIKHSSNSNPWTSPYSLPLLNATRASNMLSSEILLYPLTFFSAWSDITALVALPSSNITVKGILTGHLP